MAFLRAGDGYKKVYIQNLRYTITKDTKKNGIKFHIKKNQIQESFDYYIYTLWQFLFLLIMIKSHL